LRRGQFGTVMDGRELAPEGPTGVQAVPVMDAQTH